MECAPTQFVPYPSVVAALREVKVGAIKKAYAKWASKNEPALVALARTHRMGVVGLQCGLRGVIERLHLDAIAEKAPREIVMPARQLVPTVRDECCEERPLKRPRARAHRPQRVTTPRRHPMPSSAQASMQAAWEGKGMHEQAHSVCVSEVLKGIFRGDAFAGGCLNEAFFGGSLRDVAPELRPDGAADAGSQLQDLFDDLQDNANVLEKRGELSWIKVHNSGQYSLVCRPTNNSRLPLIARKDVVVRFPRPSRSGPAPAAEVATELANLLEAARGNFGPEIVAAVAQVYLPESAMLMVCMDRAHSTLYESVNHADNNHSAVHWEPHLLHVAGLLRDTVFAFSSRRVLFLDCSPGNFLLRGPLEACTDVLVSDLDPQLYRRTEQTADTCLLLNLLMVGAHIRKHATEEFASAWRSVPTGARTLYDFVATLPRAGLALVLWSESFTRWKRRSRLTDATLEEDTLGVLFHYFVSSVVRENALTCDPRLRHILDTRALPAMHYFAGALGWPRPLVDVLLDFWNAPLGACGEKRACGEERSEERARKLKLVVELVKRIDAADRPEEEKCTLV